MKINETVKINRPKRSLRRQESFLKPWEVEKKVVGSNKLQLERSSSTPLI